jgi:hypothetical protein
MTMVGESPEALKAWEAEFVLALQTSGHKELMKVETCSISMTPAPPLLSERAIPLLTEEPSEKVNVDVSCDVHLGDLGVVDAAIAGHTLLETYNSIYESVGRDDCFLENESFTPDGAGVPFEYTYDIGCKADDDFLENLKVIIGLWEAEFVTALQAVDGSAALAKVTTCNISMEGVSAVAVATE